MGRMLLLGSLLQAGRKQDTGKNMIVQYYYEYHKNKEINKTNYKK